MVTNVVTMLAHQQTDRDDDLAAAAVEFKPALPPVRQMVGYGMQAGAFAVRATILLAQPDHSCRVPSCSRMEVDWFQ
jgi:hypothetical protein